jgi:hypothetical protein
VEAAKSEAQGVDRAAKQWLLTYSRTVPLRWRTEFAEEYRIYTKIELGSHSMGTVRVRIFRSSLIYSARVANGDVVGVIALPVRNR